MKILILSWGFDPERQGGIARFCSELAIGLQQAGVITELWGVLAQGTARERHERQRLEALGIHTRVVPPYPGAAQTTLTAALMAVQRVLQQRPHVVSVHGVLAELCGLAITAQGSVPVVRTVHSEREWYKRPRLGTIVDQLYARWGAGEIGVSTRVTTTINARRTQHGVRVPARWIPPITGDAVAAQARTMSQAEARIRLGIAPDAFVIGSVGRFTPQKGYDVLIDAAARLRDRGESLPVYIVGEGPLDAQLRHQISTRGLADLVHLLPPRADLGYVMRALDLFVSSSRWEGLSLSVQEAAQCGLPVVCTDVSGTDDLVRVLQTPVYVCPPGDAAALAQRIGEAKQGTRNREQAPNGYQGNRQQETRKQENLINVPTFQRSNPKLWTAEQIAQEYLDYFQTIGRHNSKFQI